LCSRARVLRKQSVVLVKQGKFAGSHESRHHASRKPKAKHGILLADG
jgi:hypothetical protein